MPRITETQNTEFKENWRDEYLRVICAFANSEGGKLILGVNDEGIAVGIKGSKKLLEDIPNKIRNRLGIIPSVNIEGRKGKSIVIVNIAPSSVPISYDGRYYLRSGSNTFELRGNELTRFLISKVGMGWDEIVEENATVDDIDFDTVEKFKTLAKERLPSVELESEPAKILEKLNLIEKGKLKKAAILLFGKDPRRFYLQAYLKIGRFKTEVDIIGSDDIEGNLFQQVEKAIEVLKKKYLKAEFKIEGLYRKEILEYPEEALREAIINALIHRDYVGSAHTQMKIYDDKIWLWNEGGLPAGISVEDLKKSHGSKPRNKILADVFFKASLIETWGRGTIKIVDSCRKAGLPEPEFKEEQGGFSVYFYKDIYTEENLRKMGLNERPIKAVLYVKEKGKITNKEYQEIAKISKPTATRELSALVDMNILVQQGITGKGTFYVLKKDSQRTRTAHKGLTNGSKGSER